MQLGPDGQHGTWKEQLVLQVPVSVLNEKGDVLFHIQP